MKVLSFVIIYINYSIGQIIKMTNEEKIEGKREKCQFCANCDSDGHCLAKENYDFFECKNDEYFEPIEE